jgi:hypothetical protein
MPVRASSGQGVAERPPAALATTAETIIDLARLLNVEAGGGDVPVDR